MNHVQKNKSLVIVPFFDVKLLLNADFTISSLGDIQHLITYLSEQKILINTPLLMLVIGLLEMEYIKTYWRPGT